MQQQQLCNNDVTIMQQSYNNYTTMMPSSYNFMQLYFLIKKTKENKELSIHGGVRFYRPYDVCGLIILFYVTVHLMFDWLQVPRSAL